MNHERVAIKMGATYTEAQKKATKKYLENFKNITIRLTEENRNKYHRLAKTYNKSLNQLVLDLLEDLYNNPK